MRPTPMGFCLGVLATIGAQGVPAEPVPAVSRPIVLKAARLFDSLSGTLTNGAVIVVQGNKIQTVGGGAPLPADAQVIEMRGQEYCVVTHRGI